MPASMAEQMLFQTRFFIMWTSYEDRLTAEKSEIFGKLFELSSSKYGFDSRSYISAVMTTPAIEDMIMNDERTEWCDAWFLSAVLNREISAYKGGEQFDAFTLWFMGYLYKYWMRTKKMRPADVYSILPVDVFLERFGFYHTQGWNYIIADAEHTRELLQ